MKSKFTLLLFLSILGFSNFSATAQTANVFIDVGGSRGTDNICTPETVALSGAEDIDGEGDNITHTGLEHGPYSFTDPVPAGNKITNIEIVLHNSACEQTISVDVSGAMIMGIMTMGTCISGGLTCPTSNNRGNKAVDFGCDPSTDYNYGGVNQFDAMLNSGGTFAVVTFTHAEIIFTYESCTPCASEGGIGATCDDGNPTTIDDIIQTDCSCSGTANIPTMSQWGLIIFGLLTMNLGVVFLRRKEKLLA